MKAAVVTGFDRPLEVVERPVAVPGDDQVLARIEASGVVLVSLPKDNIMRLPVFETVRGGISVVGSIAGTRADLAEVFRPHAAGRTSVDVEVRKLDEINEAIEDVLAGAVTARVVLQP
jgi:alcohol dehydrogenase, propanol-preferring